MHWAVGVSARGCLPEGVWQAPPGPKADIPAPCWQTDTCENITFRRSVIKFRSRWVLQLPDIIGKKTMAIFWRHYIYCTHRRTSSITANSKYCNIQWKSHKITIENYSEKILRLIQVTACEIGSSFTFAICEFSQCRVLQSPGEIWTTIPIICASSFFKAPPALWEKKCKH